jgi:isocitrate dehydrogenase kinase/phosphatase
VLDFRFERRFAISAPTSQRAGGVPPPLSAAVPLEANHQIQVLSSPFFRNQTAYIVGRVVNGASTYPFVVPVKHDAAGKLYFDALVMDHVDLALLFSANRAYFLVDMEVPSAYVDFLRAILRDKTAAELYTMVGLQKAGKNLFFRDFLHHLKHSRDKFIIAPGIKGLVMTVFTLPSYPYVFKVIRDKIAASKDTDRAKVKAKYWLVKHHDRVGTDDRHPRILGRRLSARALFRRASGRADGGRAVGARDRPRSRRHRPPLHRAAADSAQSVPREGRRCAPRARDA